MTRMIASVAVLMACAAPGFADAAKQAKLCAELGKAADMMAAQRQSGSGEQSALVAVFEELGSKDAAVNQTLPMIADFVYGLPKAKLSKGVGAAFEEQCAAYKG